MNVPLRYGILLVLILGTGVLLVLFVATPVIYTPEKDTFPSRYHNNTEVLREQSLNSTTDMFPLMQDLLDYSGPIVLNVKIHDIDQARRDLESFSKNRVALSNLVIKLDMTEGEMQEYSKSLALQEKLLDDLSNSTEVLDQLKTLEIQYRDENNPNQLISVRLEEDALRKKIRDLYAPYATEASKTIAFSKNQSLDTTSAEQGLVYFKQYVDEVTAEEQAPVVLPPNLLTLVLIPERGKYGDTVVCTGYLVSPAAASPGVSRRTVTVFIDNTTLSSSVTDASGHYAVQFPIGKISSGSHRFRAESGTAISETRILTVIPVNSVTSLSLEGVNSRGGARFTGSVLANRPVRRAPVQLVWDGTHVVEATTDTNGQFTTVLQLPSGTHTVIARFTGSGYPINPSESETLEVEISILQEIVPAIVPTGSSWIFLPLVMAAIALVFLGGALYYLRRSGFIRSGNSSAGKPAFPGRADPVRKLLLRGILVLTALYPRRVGRSMVPRNPCSCGTCGSVRSPG
jgi:hypothetical protein